jgi:hypothetical protein
MGEVFSNDTVWIRKSVLRLRERHAVLGMIFEVFLDVPFKARFAHGTRLADEEDKYHIKIWLYIWLCLFNLQPLTQVSGAAKCGSEVRADAVRRRLQTLDTY